MKALTVLQPYATPISFGWKLLENRGWKPPAAKLPFRLAIHAGKALMDADEFLTVHNMVRRYFPMEPNTKRYFARVCDNDFGKVLAVATVDGFITVPPTGDQLVWWVGPIGWLLSSVRRLAMPVPCRGMQGLWNLPDDIERQVLEQVGL